ALLLAKKRWTNVSSYCALRTAAMDTAMDTIIMAATPDTETNITDTQRTEVMVATEVMVVTEVTGSAGVRDRNPEKPLLMLQPCPLMPQQLPPADKLPSNRN
ncbi:Uncharacterized protein APZ42_003946, partial [Daphnia magna]